MNDAILMFWIALALALPAGPLLFRPIAAKKLRKRLLMVADAMLAEARDLNVHNNHHFHELRSMVLQSAVYAPLCAAGMVKPIAIDSSADLDRVAFLKRNGWILPYLGAHHCSVRALLFFGQPWDPRTWRDAVLATIVLGMFSRPNGGLTIVSAPDEAAQHSAETAAINDRGALAEQRLTAACH